MKNGLLTYKARGRKKNIGDYIQSVAAEQYTGRNVVYVEKELTNEYSGEPIKLIMNGWWMHCPQNWPPSEKILPLLTSVHIRPQKMDPMFSKEGIEFFKKYGPVGCRDKGTEKLLKSKGIAAYYSGCLTLTLGKTFKHDPNSKNVYFVEPYYEVAKNPLAVLDYLLTFFRKGRSILKISDRFHKSTSLKNVIRTLGFYRIYSKFFEDEILVNAEYINHMVEESDFADEEAKFEYSRNLLQKYADSRLVVSSRIHAVLPCIGIGTPSILTISDDLQPNSKGLHPFSAGRFEGLIDLFNVLECINAKLTPIQGFKIEKKIGLNHSIKNKQNHLKIVEELDKQCTAFINSKSKKVEEAIQMAEN